MSIERGSLVTLHVELFDEEGLPLGEEDDEPVRYRHGEGELLPGLERALAGASAGDELRVTLPPEDAFGPHQPDGLISVPLGEFPGVEGLEEGAWVTISVTADDPADEVEDGDFEARVVEVGDEEVVLDANHPLAGRTIEAHVRVLAVDPGGGGSA